MKHILFIASIFVTLTMLLSCSSSLHKNNPDEVPPFTFPPPPDNPWIYQLLRPEKLGDFLYHANLSRITEILLASPDEPLRSRHSTLDENDMDYILFSLLKNYNIKTFLGVVEGDFEAEHIPPPEMSSSNINIQSKIRLIFKEESNIVFFLEVFIDNESNTWIYNSSNGNWLAKLEYNQNMYDKVINMQTFD